MTARSMLCWRCRQPLYYDPAIGQVCVNRTCDAPDEVSVSNDNPPPIFRAIRRTAQSTGFSLLSH